MGLHQISNLNEEMQKAHEWFGEVAVRLKTDKNQAYKATRPVLHALRDRLTVEEATDLAAQLPVVIKGIYFDGYNPSGKPEEIKTKDDFLKKVKSESKGITDVEANQATDAVMDVLTEKVTEGEIEDIRDTLPENLKDLLAGE